MKEQRKSVFNWNHISDELTNEQIDELKSYYHTYHKKCWAYKQNRDRGGWGRFILWPMLRDGVIKGIIIISTNKNRNASKNGDYWVTHCPSYLHLEVSLAV